MKKNKLIACLAIVAGIITTTTFTFRSNFLNSSSPLINNINALASGESHEWIDNSTSGTKELILKEAYTVLMHSSAGSYYHTVPAEVEAITCCVPSNEFNKCDGLQADSRC